MQRIFEKKELDPRSSHVIEIGNVFTRQPTLVTSDASIQLMDTIFEQGSFAIQIQLMKVFQMFLANEEERLEKKEAGKPKHVNSSFLG